jgi:hypothetical protein
MNNNNNNNNDDGSSLLLDTCEYGGVAVVDRLVKISTATASVLAARTPNMNIFFSRPDHVIYRSCCFQRKGRRFVTG